MKRLIHIVLAVLLVLTLTACQVSIVRPQQPTGASGPADNNPKEIYFTTADLQRLPAGKVKDWYNANYKQAGLHSITDGADQYLLISAGEKKLQGSFIDDILVTGEVKQLRVSARLYEPSPEISAVAPGVNYPHVVVKINKDSRDLSFNLTEFSKAVPYRLDTGRVVRLPSKDNSLEMAISGKLASTPPASYGLSMRVAPIIARSEIAVNDEVRFAYANNRQGQPVVLSLDKIVPTAPAPGTRVAAVFVGLADNHTVELTVAGQAMAFQVTEAMKPQVEALQLKKGDKVDLRYVENENKQLIITEIKLVK